MYTLTHNGADGLDLLAAHLISAYYSFDKPNNFVRSQFCD